MSANNKFEIMIDFLVNLKTDPSQIDKFAQEFAEKAKGLNININSEQMKAGITDVLTNLKALESEGGHSAAGHLGRADGLLVHCGGRLTDGPGP
jgi:hypothetical protein